MQTLEVKSIQIQIKEVIERHEYFEELYTQCLHSAPAILQSVDRNLQLHNAAKTFTKIYSSIEYC